MTAKVASDYRSDMVIVDGIQDVRDTRDHHANSKMLSSLPVPEGRPPAATDPNLILVSRRRLLAYLRRNAPIQAAVSDGLTYHCINIMDVREDSGRYRIIYEDWAPSFEGTFLQQHKNIRGVAAELYQENGRASLWSVTESEFFRLECDFRQIRTQGGNLGRDVNPIETSIRRAEEAYYCHVHSRVDFTFLLSHSVPLVTGSTEIPSWRLSDLDQPVDLSLRIIVPPEEIVRAHDSAYDIDANLILDYSVIASNEFKQNFDKPTADHMRLCEDPLGEPYLIRSIHTPKGRCVLPKPDYTGPLADWDTVQVHATSLHSGIVVHFVLEAATSGASLPNSTLFMHRIALSIMREGTEAHKRRDHWLALMKSGKLQQYMIRK